jgi:uncharacterized protein YuzE
MKLELDKHADAAYIHLAAGPYDHGEDLDDVRRIDYAADGTPVGIELLYVSRGVDLEGLPEQDSIASLLRAHGIQVYVLKQTIVEGRHVHFDVWFEPLGEPTGRGGQVTEGSEVTV